ncbi:hypothetical protein QQ045_027482 [Rhodiola kirilowii]
MPPLLINNPFCWPFALAMALLLSHFTEIEASHVIYPEWATDLQSIMSDNQPYRSAFHFQPPRNWMNGPMIYKGIYHFFYQYNPYGAVWGNIVWAHSTSTDLINWTPHNHAIRPDDLADINGCWSGSATILPNGKPVILYTGVDPQNNQVQNIVLPKNSTDPYLREWVKPSKVNPLMAPTSSNKINASSFRDPTTAWIGPDGHWRTLIGGKINRRGLAILYRSGDFKHWVKQQHPLFSAKDNGMWECPDFYPVSVHAPQGMDTSVMGSHVKHVLKVSLDDTKHDYYTIGSYRIVNGKDVYVPDMGSVNDDSGLRYDYGKFYASKTFFDSSKNRRVLWGWVNESSSVADDVAKGWSGVQAIPRTVRLDLSGKQLIQWPVKELEILRINKVDSPSKLIKNGSSLEVSGITAAQADVEISFKIVDLSKVELLNPSWTNPQALCSQKGAAVHGGVGPFGLKVLASGDLQEYTAVFFRAFKAQNSKYVVLMCSDQSRSSLNDKNDKTTYGAFLNVDPVHEEVSLRTLIDHSIVESFGGGGKSCITARVYPTQAIHKEAHLYAFNNGAANVKMTKLSAWSMKKAKINT